MKKQELKSLADALIEIRADFEVMGRSDARQDKRLELDKLRLRLDMLALSVRIYELDE